MESNHTNSEQRWQAACQVAVKAIVSILSYAPRPFDTSQASAADATGFVVDAKEGIILTNRHVAGPGPFRGRCIFHNQEQVDVSVLWYDPIHDFAFLKFDPAAVKRMKVAELKLRPDLAVIGLEIRVIGNDAAQMLSISGGTISRLNRNPTVYSGYSDFNTNYIQASAMTSGGSSGSPVINHDGDVVALNAGSFTNASVALFLPLEQPSKALQHILKNEPILRGTLQVHWNLLPFHQCQTLGLTDEWITKIHQLSKDETSMLVAKSVLPGGPAESLVQEGDILLTANGNILTRFNDLTNLLDSNVGNSVILTIQRGEAKLDVTVEVEDLDAITPNQYLTVGGALFHNFSYILATQYRLPVRQSGLYLCHANGSFNFGTGGHLIQSIDGKATKDLGAFSEAIESIPDGKCVRVAFKSLTDVNKLQFKIIVFDRRLCRLETATRSFETGVWIKTDIPNPPALEAKVSQCATLVKTQDHKYPQAAYLSNCIVLVKVFRPIPVEGDSGGNCTGLGLIINEELGLILVSKDVALHAFCICDILICGSIMVPGKVLFLHPVQNYAILRYDPSAVEPAVPRARLSAEEIKPGDTSLIFRASAGSNLEFIPTNIAGIRTFSPSPKIAPGTTGVSLEALIVDTSISISVSGCGLVSQDGTVQALWMGSYCVSTATIVPILKEMENDLSRAPTIRLLGVRLNPIQMGDAKAMGVPQDWVSRVESEKHRQLFVVTKPYAGHSSGFEEGDVILSLNGELITQASSIFKPDLAATLEAVVVRNLNLMSLSVTSFSAENIATSEILLFCGSILCRPHMAIRQRVSHLHSEVYVAGYMHGSATHRYEIWAQNFITHVNGVSTPDIEEFVKQVSTIPDGEYFRLTGMSIQNIQFVKTMKKDDYYFPMIKYKRDSEEGRGWKEYRM